MRSAPALINRGYGRAFFWDGRAATLEQQVLQPIQDANEMNMTLPEVSARVGVTPADLADALASYVRAIRSGNSRFDRFVNGDRRTLSDEERQGMELFRGRGSCATCHVGPNFTDERFHNTGVAWQEGRFRDDGRAAVTGKDSERGAFKTPTLRESGYQNRVLDPEIKPLRLTPGEKSALVAFLLALNGEVIDSGR